MPDVIDNWMSATREDCVRLSQIRPGMGDVPLISQIRAVQDLKHMLLVDVARDYRVPTHSVAVWRDKGSPSQGHVPAGPSSSSKPDQSRIAYRMNFLEIR